MGEVPSDLYQESDIVPTDEYKPFTKMLSVYGIKLIAEEAVPDDFLRLVAKTIREMFPQDAGLDAELQKQVITNLYRYRALIPVFLGDEPDLPGDERWEDIERQNSVCDIIMAGVGGQVMEVVEHILHFVSDVGLHYTFPREWGLAGESELRAAMDEAAEKGYYDIEMYEGDDEKDIIDRVKLQEFAHWVITTAWNLQEPYGPGEDNEEWTIRNEAHLRAKLPKFYAFYQRTVGKVMVSPSKKTLAEIEATPIVERDDEDEWDADERDRPAAIIKPCEADIAAGKSLGIVAVPAEFQDTYGKLFGKYTEVLAPNGRPIRIFAQDQISNDQMVYARQVLKFFIEDVPGSRYGSDKTAVANRIADSGETLLLLNGYDGEFPVFNNEDWEHISGCALYHEEIAPPGSDWYINNRYESHRDATFEEILHLVHDFVIGVHFKGMPPGVLPEFQREIRAAEINALETEGLWAKGKGEEESDWIKNLREGGSLTQKYLAAVVDTYYGLWGACEESVGGLGGGMWGFYVAKTRDEIPKKDPMGYALMEAFFNPWLTFEARIDAGFDGVFSLAFDPKLPYTHKSQYLLRARLTGDLNSGLRGNDQNNVLRGNASNNKLNGGGGKDTARFTGNAREYWIQRDQSGLVVTDSVEGRDGVDRLVSIEWLEFADGRRSAAEPAGDQIKVLIIDGVNNHDWETTRNSSNKRSRSTFTKQVEVFGLHIYATNTTGDDKLLHAANILAEYIDNDEDGIPDNPKIMKALIEGKGAIVVRKTEGERTTGPRPRGQGLYDEETVPNARAQGRFDASLEEILHMITDEGYGVAYPEVFGRVPGTEISNAMDKARGGRFMEVPDRYPDDAWFTYYDETCDYDSMNSEYIYWVLTSILGAQDFPGRYEQIKDEWRLNTREKVKEGDPAAYALFTDPKYNFPTVSPDGKYKAKTFTIQKYP